MCHPRNQQVMSSAKVALTSAHSRAIWVPAFAGTSGLGRPLASLRRAGRRKGDRLDFGQVELAGGMIDVEPDNFAVGIEVDHETCDDLSSLGARRAFEFDIKAVRFRIVMQLHRSSSRKLRSSSPLLPLVTAERAHVVIATPRRGFRPVSRGGAAAQF